MHKKAVSLLAGLMVCLAWGVTPSFSNDMERITDFRSRITVHPDASITVTEVLTVYCAGREIQRGIVRDFPTRYRARSGGTVTVPFQIVSIQKDGRPEPYHVKEVVNGKKIYIGQKDVLLKPGLYTYAITYKTGRQLGFFESYDELYWNVTGNDWTFPIERAEAVVQIPEGGVILQEAAYTGPQGAKGKDFVIDSETDGSIRFRTTRTLTPGEGFTVAIAWPKGLVAEPTKAEKTGYFLSAQTPLIISVGGIALLVIYYMVAWFKAGRDPKRGTIIPLFEPPEGFTPAAARYVLRMGYDNKAMAVAIVNMAVKGYLKIEEDRKKGFTLVRVSNHTNALSPRERMIADSLFGGSDRIVLTNKNHAKIGKAVTALKRGLKVDFEKAYFVKNWRYFIPGVVITLLILGALALFASDRPDAGFIGLWLTVWTIGCTALFFVIKNAWKTAWRGPLGAKRSAVMITLFGLPFFLGEVIGIGVFASQTSIGAVMVLVAMALLNLLFYHLLKAPTLLGRKIMDRLEGFKLYLSKAEAHRLRVLHPPERTPELFERFLPYALALDVEHAWSEQFSDVLAAAGKDGAVYSPTWYSGSSFRDLGGPGLASSLGSAFSGAIASSATAPGSRSGSGGGGSSGGGGGGGGGSGW
ncbi:MAG: DUF2207 domain-containing protein [Candidatus Desulfacyla sp.]